MPPHHRHPQIPSSAQTSTPNFDTFFSPLSMVATNLQTNDNQTYNVYTQKSTLSICTERELVCFFSVLEFAREEKLSVASFTDQMEYYCTPVYREIISRVLLLLRGLITTLIHHSNTFSIINDLLTRFAIVIMLLLIIIPREAIFTVLDIPSFR